MAVCLGLVVPLAWLKDQPANLPRREELLAGAGGAFSLEGRLAKVSAHVATPLAARVEPRARSLQRHLANYERLCSQSCSAEELAGWGLATLLAGRPERAVDRLAAAVERAPGEAIYWNDLSVAYIARATELNQPLDLLRAAEASERALEIHPARIEARYNRAVAVGHFGLIPMALEFWSDYLDQERDPRWSRKVRRRISALEGLPLLAPSPPAPPGLPAELGRDLVRNDYAAVHRKVLQARKRSSSLADDLFAARLAWAEGLAQARTGYPHLAIAELETASTHLGRLGDRAGQGWLRLIIAENLSLLGQNREAWAARAEAAQLLSRANNADRLHSLLADLGDRAQEEGLPRVALQVANFAVEALHKANSTNLCEALLWRARLAVRQGRPDAANADLEQALQALREARSPELAQRFAADIDVVRATLLADKAPAEALVTTRKALAFYRSKDLRFDLAQVYALEADALHALGDFGGVELALRNAAREFDRTRVRGAPFDSELSYLERAQTYVDAQLDLAEAQQRDPWELLAIAEQARNLPSAPLPGPAKALLQRVAGQLPPESVALVFAVTPRHLLSWTLVAGRLHQHVKSIDPGDLRRRISGWKDAIRRDQPTGRWAEDGHTLFQDLLGEALRFIPAGQTIFVVPDRYLAGLPFAALPDPRTSRFLIEDHALAMVPSLAALGKILERESGRRPELLEVALFASSLAGQQEQLLQANAEVRQLSSLYPKAEIFGDAAATREVFLAALRKVEAVHFAGHVVHNVEQPSLSHLLFAGQGNSLGKTPLYAHELEDAPMPRLRLAVLAGCNSAGMTTARAGSIAGLARPFVNGGASAVVATLWNVSDAASPEIVTAFHRNLLLGLSGPKALQAAQLEAISSTSRNESPSTVWAAFQLIGYLAGEE